VFMSVHCPCVRSTHSRGRISWSIFTKIGKNTKTKNEFIAVTLKHTGTTGTTGIPILLADVIGRERAACGIGGVWSKRLGGG